MKKIIRQLRIYSFIAIIGLTFTGCASFWLAFTAVRIRTNNNLSSVRPGGSLQLRASGRSIRWSISSTSNGAGPVDVGTYITQDGMLTVAANEPALYIYVFAVSMETDQSDIRQIRIVTVNSVNVSPANQTVAIGRSFQFRASVTGTNNPDSVVTWRVGSNPAGTGFVAPGTTINSRGELSISPNEANRTLYITATSVVDPQVSGSVFVNVVVPTVTHVTVSPANQTVRAGNTLRFRAAVTGTYEPDDTVTWRVSSNPAGTGAVTPGTTINNTGMLTVAPNESLSILYVIATSTVDPSKFGSVHVYVIRPTITGISIAPSNISIPAGIAVQFTANVTGTNNPDTAVTWRVSSNAAGTGAVAPGTRFDNNGLLTIAANETATTLFVFATSAFDPTKFSSIIVTVTTPVAPLPAPTPVPPPTPTPTPTPPPPPIPPPTPPPPTVTNVVVGPINLQLARGQVFQFVAAVSGTNNPSAAVIWSVSSNAEGTGAVMPGTIINVNGLLTVAANETAELLYVFATSVVDPSKLGSVVVTVTEPTAVFTGVTVIPSSQTLRRGSSLQLRATVEGYTNPNPPMSWRVSSTPDGTGAVSSGTRITGNGSLTVGANESAQILYVIAIFNPDSSRFGMAVITVQ